MVTLDDIKRWKVPALKDYLRKRGLKTSGRKEELCALVYAAHIENKPILLSASEATLAKALDYKSLLVVGEHTLPDPFVDLQTGWQNERQGMTDWPPTMQLDIATFLLTHYQDRELSKRLLSDYKEGKAYSYFDSAWLKEVFYHPISPSSTLCVLKSSSTPSNRIHDINHQMWVAIEKKTGTVCSAYCTCFAG